MATVQGVLPRNRADVWYRAVGAVEARAASSKTYAEFLAESDSLLDEQTLLQIKKDLPRTFGDSHSRFTDSAPDSLIGSLDRVLRAVMAVRPGYWQGINFVAAYVGRRWRWRCCNAVGAAAQLLRGTTLRV